MATLKPLYATGSALRGAGAALLTAACLSATPYPATAYHPAPGATDATSPATAARSPGSGPLQIIPSTAGRTEPGLSGGAVWPFTRLDQRHTRAFVSYTPEALDSQADDRSSTPKPDGKPDRGHEDGLSAKRFPLQAKGDLELESREPNEESAAVAEQEATGLAVSAAPTKLAPDAPQYRDLGTSIEAYRRLVKEGGWEKVSSRATLRMEETSDAVAALRRRLVASGDLAPVHARGNTFDQTVEEAVRRFQARHGLEIDGVVGGNTFKELNVPASVRLAQLELNGKRQREMPDRQEGSHVRVNLADQTLELVRHGDVVWRSRVIIGKGSSPTPVFSDSMEYIVLNPYWNVPSSIAATEMLPLLRRDPGALARRNIQVISTRNGGPRAVDPWYVDWHRISARNFPYRLRQWPGSKNALGRVKFMFPNEHKVYIHDTPTKHLFTQARRTFSHGCVRLENPRDLAARILEAQGWSSARIDAIIASGKRQVVRLDEPVPVHLTYFTAWVDGDGQVQFRRDVYQRDGNLVADLQE